MTIAMILNMLTYALLFCALYFEVLMLVSFLTRRSRSYTATCPIEIPSVAIIVPCFNEEKTVAGTIESLLALQYPRNLLEIIVVDDGSKDATYAIAREYACDSRVRVLRKANGGKHTAMNMALAHTRAELIGCLDADSTVAPDALMRVATAFADPGITAVTPGIHARTPETWIQHLQKAEYHLSIFVRNAFASLGSIFITPGPFSIFRASIVRELGGWKKAHNTEDLELGLRLQERGHIILNDPEAIVFTKTPERVYGLFRQRLRWTYGFLRNVFDYRHMVGNPRYGNLGLIILPTALISIFAALYFFAAVIIAGIKALVHLLWQISIIGLSAGAPTVDPFYLNTSALWLIVITGILAVIGIISTGSYISTGSRRLPVGVIPYVLVYGFLAPVWLGAAVMRAALGRESGWR